MFLHRLLTVILLVLLILHVHEEIERQHQNKEVNFPEMTEQLLSSL